MKSFWWALVLVVGAAMPLVAQEGPGEHGPPPGLPPEAGLGPGQEGLEGFLTPEERGRFEKMNMEEKCDFLAGKRVEHLEREKERIDRELAKAREDREKMKGLPPEEKVELALDRMAERLRRRLAERGMSEEEIEKAVAEHKDEAKNLANMPPGQRRKYLREKFEERRSRFKEKLRERLRQVLTEAGVAETEVEGIVNAADAQGEEGPGGLGIRDRIRDLLKDKGFSEDQIREVLHKLRGRFGGQGEQTPRRGPFPQGRRGPPHEGHGDNQVEP